MQNEFELNMISGLAVFLENALRNTATYLQHSNRTHITSRDIILALKVEVFKFGNRPTFEYEMTNARDVISTHVSEHSESSRDSSETSSSVASIDIPEKNTCTCEVCSDMNTIEARYSQWTPQTELEESVHRAIQNSERHFSALI